MTTKTNPISPAHSLSRKMYALALDWAWDRANDPSHCFVSGLPFGFANVGLNNYADNQHNAVCSLLADAFGTLAPKALNSL